MSTVFDRMKQILADEGYPIGQFYEDFGLSNSSFTDWRRSKDGYPPISILVRFSQQFNVSLDYLLFGKDSTTEKLENSSLNSEDELLLAKFHSLPIGNQLRLLGYIDGMIAATRDNEELQ